MGHLTTPESIPFEDSDPSDKPGLTGFHGRKLSMVDFSMLVYLTVGMEFVLARGARGL